MLTSEILAGLDGVRAHGDTWTARCPAHEDHTPSLSISTGGDGRTLLKCFAGCSTDAIVGALGFTLADLFVEAPTPARDIVATYDYADEHGTVLFQVCRTLPKGFFQRLPDGTPRLNGVRRVLYRLPELVAAIAAGERVFVTEGEKDANAIVAKGYAATCNPGGAGKWRHEFTEMLRAADVVVVADKDAPGYAHARQVATALHGIATKVVVVEAVVGKDVSDHLAAGKKLSELVPVAEVKDEDAPGPVLVRVSDVRSEAVQWLWPGYLPLGKLVVLDGDPELGKSTVTLDLAARISTGRPMPDGAPTIAGGVVLLSAEDGAADTVRPRLDAAGAALERVALLKAVRDVTGREGGVTLPDHLPELRQAIEQLKAVLVVVDTFTAYLSGAVNSRIDHDIRRTLAPLAQLAEVTGATILLIRHLNKQAGGNPIYRGGGSIGIIGAARMGLLVAPDPDAVEGDESRRVFAVIKSNLAPKPASLAFRLVSADNHVSRVAWSGVSPYRAAALVQVPTDPDERHERDEARDVLRELLTVAKPATDVRRATEGAGLSWRTVRRAADELHVIRAKRGFGESGEWVWELPKVATPLIPQTVATLGDRGHLRAVATPYETPREGQSAKVATVGIMDTLGTDCPRCGRDLAPDGGAICSHCQPAEWLAAFDTQVRGTAG